MRAVGLYEFLPIENENSLVDINIPNINLLKKRELLVKIKAISVNPIDVKVRASKSLLLEDKKFPKILGWDASGIVKRIGAGVSMFDVGDDVYYSGELLGQGTNAEYQAIDERLVALKPKNMSYEQAAGIPLVTITAWEAIFDKLEVKGDNKEKSILIIGGGGGVGSMAIQLAKNFTSLKIIATTSREATKKWCIDMGADYVLDHSKDIKAQLRESLKIEFVDYILCCSDTTSYYELMVDIIAPFGKICCLVDAQEKIDFNKLKLKSVSFMWEFMMCKPLYKVNMISHHNILKKVAKLIEDKKVKQIVNRVFPRIDASNLKIAHKAIEGGKTVGKIVLKDFM